MNKQEKFAKLRVMAIDDNRHMLRLLGDLLRAIGIRDVRSFTDPETALEEWQLFGADLIITDLKMEPVDGCEFASRVRQSPGSGNANVPILAVTAYSEPWRVEKARDAGINEFLVKPISAKGLDDRIVTMFQKPREFVATSMYVGPDRRRRTGPDFGSVDRRSTNSGTR